MNSNDANGQTRPGFDPFTVSVVFCDGSGKLVAHCYAADAQAAQDQVLMQTGGAAVIASVFSGHLVEADAEVREVRRDPAEETEAVGSEGESA
jgi:hypothetical protein